MTAQSITKQIIPILKRQGVLKASIFGSFARGDDNEMSDVDILVKLENNKTLFDLVELRMLLESKLNKKVDILTYKSVHPFLRKAILQEQKLIYEKR
ncbi:MAG: polymerase subunit beta protein [Candidatus Peregrinibacteria bacterium GW2011_GWF2_38_29]|nr:MAG: polymerase subunit beta protein [Candidatus Peregrinibacteria bacterium GW2011_GWF2_38_29]HBB02893.1 hypothetical protein [Candidatus Peregrinibacteria bacterium]